MNILIAADHAGYELKENLKAEGKRFGVTFEDLGTHSIESVDYPDFANSLCETLLKRPAGGLGVLICGSGVGVSIAANRHHHIRAVLAETETTARLGREHNHANVLCLGARDKTLEQTLKIFEAFLKAKPDLGERHVRRVQKLD